MRRIIYPIRTASLLEKIDQTRLGVLRAQVDNLPSNAPAYWQHYGKYLDVGKRLRINVERAQDLNLHRSPPLDILDIGCGGGFFLFIAESLGHRALGIDIAGIPVFDGLIDLLKVERMNYRITAFQPLPTIGHKFDLITAFATAFHGGQHDSWRWGAGEWDFFITDLKRHVKPEGRIFLDLNAAYDGSYYVPEIRQVFVRQGGRIERGKITFVPDGSALR